MPEPRRLQLSRFARDEPVALAAAIGATADPGDLIKEEPRTVVFRARLPSGMAVVVKTYRKRSAYAFARESLTRFRVQREFDALGFLVDAQIPAAVPVCWACGGDRRMGRYETLVTVEVPEVIELKAYLRSGDVDGRWVASVARLVRRGHQAGFYHGALAPRNVLLRRGAAGAPECLFIDTPRSIVFPRDVTGTRMARHDLLMLLCEVHNVTGDAPLAPFLRDYGFAAGRIPAMVAAIRTYRANRNTRNRMAAEFQIRRMIS